MLLHTKGPLLCSVRKESPWRCKMEHALFGRVSRLIQWTQCLAYEATHFITMLGTLQFTNVRNTNAHIYNGHYCHEHDMYANRHIIITWLVNYIITLIIYTYYIIHRHDHFRSNKLHKCKGSLKQIKEKNHIKIQKNWKLVRTSAPYMRQTVRLLYLDNLQLVVSIALTCCGEWIYTTNHFNNIPTIYKFSSLDRKLSDMFQAIFWTKQMQFLKYKKIDPIYKLSQVNES